MSESTAGRKFFRELTMILESPVSVKTSSNKTYTGILKGYDPNTLSICLADVKDETGAQYHKVFLYGGKITELIKTEEPFDLAGLANELQKLFPPGEVKYIEDARLITVLNKIKVTESGVEGTGPLAERVKKVFDAYYSEKQKQ